MTEFFVWFSGEHPSLPRDEFFGVVEGEGVRCEEVECFGRLSVFRVDVGDLGFLFRPAFVLRAAKSYGFFSDLGEAASRVSVDLSVDKTVAVRSHSMSLEREFGGFFFRLGYRIDLSRPDQTVVCVKTGKGVLVGLEIPLERTYGRRRPQHRPYFHPTSMHPKLARALVNLSRIRRGATVLDPFCGTGGILIEAGLCGMKVLGSDLDRRSVFGTKENLEYFGLSGEVRCLDALRIGEVYGGVDAVVTDPPYARSSFSSERDLKGFYERFISAACSVLKRGGRLVFMVPQEYEISFGGMRFVSDYFLRVHRSLTRRIIVLEKE